MAFNNILRMKNLFGPSESFNQMNQPTPYQAPPHIDENIQTDVEKPDRGALSRIYDMMSSMPERGKVGTKGKIGGFLMALGGRSPENIDRTVQSKYYEGMEDFDRKIDPLLKAGKLESDTANTQSLTDYRMGNVANAGLRAKIGAANTTSLIADRKADNDRAERALELKRHLGDRPDTILRKSPGINDQLIDKRTGKVLAEYPVGTLRTDEEEALKQAGRLEVIDAQGTNLLRNIAAQGAANVVTKQTPSGNVTNQTPAAERRAVLNRLDKIKSAFPGIGDVITLDEHGGINIAPEVDPDTRDKIMWLLYSDNGQKPPQSLIGTGVPPPPPNSIPMTGGNNTVNQTPIGGNPPAKIKMMRADGTTRMVSPEHIQIAIQQGFKQVQ